MKEKPNKLFMAEAISLAGKNVAAGNGGPFGAVVVRDGQIVATGYNRVTEINDPTAHADVVAIRNAGNALGTFDLSGCEIYSSCEPCPMCLSAIYWARIPIVYYGCTKEDAAAIGFDDNAIYEYIRHPEQHQAELHLVPLDRPECLQNFVQWQEKADKTMY